MNLVDDRSSARLLHHALAETRTSVWLAWHSRVGIFRSRRLPAVKAVLTG